MHSEFRQNESFVSASERASEAFLIRVERVLGQNINPLSDEAEIADCILNAGGTAAEAVEEIREYRRIQA